MAKDSGLVTELKTEQQVEDRLTGAGRRRSERQDLSPGRASAITCAPRTPRDKLRGKGAAVGVVVASGEILDGKQPPGTIGGESTAQLLRQARLDDEIKAVVLRIDSPGGSVLASEQIYREVQALKQAGKPVVVSMSDRRGLRRLLHRRAAPMRSSPAPTPSPARSACSRAFPTFNRTLAQDRHQRRRRRHHAAVGCNPSSIGRCRPVSAGCCRARSITPTSNSCARGHGPRQDARRHRCDRAGPRLGGRDALPHRAGGSPRQLSGCGAVGRQARGTQGGYGVRRIEPELTLAAAAAAAAAIDGRGLLERMGVLHESASVSLAAQLAQRICSRWIASSRAGRTLSAALGLRLLLLQRRIGNEPPLAQQRDRFDGLRRKLSPRAASNRMRQMPAVVRLSEATAPSAGSAGHRCCLQTLACKQLRQMTGQEADSGLCATSSTRRASAVAALRQRSQQRLQVLAG